MATYAGASSSTTFTETGVPPNTYYYKVTAEDAAGNVSAPSSEASVFVLFDTTPPTVTMTAPASGAVSGSIVISANATDGVSTPRVVFKLDGQTLGNPIVAPPYSITWNTTTTANGVHTLSAVATDAAGNSSEASVTVTVSNQPPPAGLVAAYGFNEAAGTVQVTDASGRGRPARG
jgi:hypothetical protein